MKRKRRVKRNPFSTEFPCTDMGNAERFADLNRKRLAYDYARRRWLAYDGMRWAAERGEPTATEAAKDCIRLIGAEASSTSDAKRRSTLLEHARRSESARGRNALLTLAQSELATDASEFDRDPLVLNTRSGIVELDGANVRPHRAAELVTRITSCAYDAEATADRWVEFVSEISEGDNELAAFLQRAVGYSVLGVVRDHVLFFCHGDGSNGKTTFLNALHRTFGSYAYQAPADLLLRRRGDSHPVQLAALAGKRFVVCNEVATGIALDEARVKTLTGGDTLNARFLHGNPFTFEPSHTLWLAANHKPDVRDPSEGMWRRILQIPFEAHIPTDRRDPELAQRLAVERPGILAWAIEGCQRYLKEGLRPPKSVIRASERYRAETDLALEFATEECKLDPDARVPAAELYRAFRKWCGESGERAVGRNDFYRRIERIDGVHVARPGNRKTFIGIRRR